MSRFASLMKKAPFPLPRFAQRGSCLIRCYVPKSFFWDEVGNACSRSPKTISYRVSCWNLYSNVALHSGTDITEDIGGSSSNLESNPYRGFDDSIARYTIMVQSILKAHRDSSDIESALHHCELPVTEDLVLTILRRHRSEWKSALSFFNWASCKEGYSHGTGAYNEMLDILGRMKQIELMQKLFDEMPKQGSASLVNDQTFSILLNRYSGVHMVDEAIYMFYKRKEFGLDLDIASFQTLLTSLCRHKHVEEAESLFIQKQAEFPPVIKSRNIILNGWCVLGSFREAKRFWKDILASGCKPDLFTYGTFINSLTKAGKLSTAVKLFDTMWERGCHPDVAICNCVIDALCFKKKIPEALRVFGEMSERGCKPNAATYNSLIKHICKIRRIEKAYELLDEMEREECRPNARTYTYFLKATKNPEEVTTLLQRMKRTNCEIDGDTYNLLLNLYVRWNHRKGIECVWTEMERTGLGPDQRSYTVVIHGLHHKGRFDEAIQYFSEMKSKGLIVEPRTRLLMEKIESNENK